MDEYIDYYGPNQHSNIDYYGPNQHTRKKTIKEGRKKMSVFDEIAGIQQQLLSSDLPDTITATVTEAKKTIKQGQYGGQPQLRLTLQLNTGETITTMYRIPKKWTGKGQMDTLLDQLSKLKTKLNQIEGMTFKWKRMNLTGAVKGNPRHYPVEIVKKVKA